MNTEEKSYWSEYYKNHSKPTGQSLFADFVKPFIQDETSMVELGCGNGRDALFFSKNDTVKVTAVDQCEQEVKFLNEFKGGSSNLMFLADDFTNLNIDERIDYAYSRFTLHSVNKEGEIRTLKWVSDHLKPEGMFFIEVRSIKDDLYGEGTRIGDHEFITDHYRRFVIKEDMIKNGLDVGLKLIYSIQSKGFAPFKDKDPEVIRLVFQKGA